MPEATQGAPTPAELDEALKEIASIDLYHDLPELVEGRSGQFTIDRILLSGALNTVRRHLKAQMPNAVIPAPPMFDNDGRPGLMRGRHS